MPDLQASLDRIESRNKNDLAILRQDTVPSVARAILQLRRDLLQIAHAARDPRLTPQAQVDDLVKQTNLARKKCQDALDSTETGAKQALANIRDDLATLTTVKMDVQQQLLYELQKAATRRRIDQATAAGVDAGDLITRAGATGDTIALACLREDIPFAASDSQQDQNRLESLLAQIDQAERPLDSAMQTASRQIEQELATGMTNLTTSFALARREAVGARSQLGNVGVASTIADWNSTGYPVAFTTPDGGLNAPDTPKGPGAPDYR
jgi:hypothetical protein